MAEAVRNLAKVALSSSPADEVALALHDQTDRRPHLSDEERAETLARDAAGQEFQLFLAFCSATRSAARRRKRAAVSRGVAPGGLANPVLSGDDVERAMQAHRSIVLGRH